MTKTTKPGDRRRAWAWSIAAGAVVVGVLLSPRGPSPREVLARGTPCGDVRLAPGLKMRLTGYAEKADSVPAFVVHACDESGSQCRHLASYLHAPRPAYALDADGRIRLEIFGGTVFRKPPPLVRIAGRTYPVVLRESGQTPTEDVRVFLRKTVGGTCDPAAVF